MRKLTSPILAISVAYVYILIIGIVFWLTGFYTGNNFFSLGPPIFLFGHKIESQTHFYLLHLLIFFHQLINNWVNTVVYPWIINIIQDPKTKEIPYSMTTSLILINFFDFYSEIDVVLIIMGFTSQISFVFTVTVANVITSTMINRRYILEKTEKVTKADEKTHLLDALI